MLGLGDIPSSALTTETHLTAMQPSVLCVASWDGQLSGGLCRKKVFSFAEVEVWVILRLSQVGFLYKVRVQDTSHEQAIHRSAAK